MKVDQLESKLKAFNLFSRQDLKEELGYSQWELTKTEDKPFRFLSLHREME